VFANASASRLPLAFNRGVLRLGAIGQLVEIR
jgi:hypothetical protein